MKSYPYYFLVAVICILLIYCIHLTTRITSLEEQMSILTKYIQTQCDVNHNLIKSTDILKDIVLDIQKKEGTANDKDAENPS